ncbi:hypothetical protein LCGC14_1518840 [marine sediment metagenome]|uniref:Uncharacterized protein n=1 Tax=marine sediment metagenome TaxID=412755 RepID=A0A0F9JK30_9ZZZZ
MEFKLVTTTATICGVKTWLIIKGLTAEGREITTRIRCADVLAVGDNQSEALMIEDNEEQGDY